MRLVVLTLSGILSLFTMQAAAAAQTLPKSPPNSLGQYGVYHSLDHHASSGSSGSPSRDGRDHIVMFKFKGTVDTYQPYNNSSSTAGSITMTVKSSNIDHRNLKGDVLTFAVSSSTRVLDHGMTPTQGSSVKVFVRAPKNTVFAGSSGTATAANLTATKIISSSDN